MMSGLGGTLMTGMAFGAGSEVAHQAVRGIMGSGNSHGGYVEGQGQGQAVQGGAQQAVQEYQQNPCFSLNQSFLSCLKSYSDQIGYCQQTMDNLMQCEKDNMKFYGSS